MKALAAIVMVVVLTAPLGADDLAQLKFLIGRWQAIDTAAGESGSFTFELAVQDHVMLRRNEAIYEATNRRPSSRHDDLMAIYSEGGSLKADYFDNEGHVIRYSVQPRGGNRVVFLSDAKTSEPRYRLSYSIGADGALTGTFEVAAPGSGDAFNPYLSWRARRR
ncbi:MAG: hypothetical protein DMF99_23870 [Acidobacteria bacterium]|nr:MAG: hypothetical protein DMF99_23870 [Acidobacteriota bacterium]